MQLTKEHTRASETSSQTAHGAALLAMLALRHCAPGLSTWPWHLLMPLSAYALLVCSIPHLRRSIRWARLGQLGPRVLLATVGITAASVAAVLLFHLAVRPDLHSLVRQLPTWMLTHAVLGCAVFSLVNACMEEVVFRGILLDALTTEIGTTWAILAQAIAFGIGHSQGYPPGSLGMVLAGFYGLMLGWLRWRCGGLLAPWIAHVFADATIFCIVVAAT